MKRIPLCVALFLSIFAHVGCDTGTKTAKPSEVISESTSELYTELTTAPTTSDAEQSFSDEELDSMEIVDNEINKLTNSDEWTQADTDKRRKMAVACMNQLAEQGHIIAKSICESDDMVSFSYTSGALGGIKLTPFDPMMN